VGIPQDGSLIVEAIVTEWLAEPRIVRLVDLMAADRVTVVA
jgi:hypothetical protein